MNAKVEDFFSNIYFPYQYKFIVSQINKMDPSQVIIWKVKLDNKKKQIAKLLFATWSEETGIKSFASPEDILSSHTIRAGIRHNPPLSYVKRINNELQLTGYTGEMAETLEGSLNIR
ncbi:uncharacterized protein [Chelonus insularis]|uniref:uncharacterized protein n=1 Tax=Chelonus insularis TaxID=460826 RepID=UPI001589C24C|nr:uncharacterized protein LOC118070011 [Chelonus insularis]